MPSPAIDADRLRALFLELLGIYSPSGKEHEVMAAAEAFLAAHGVDAVRQPVDEERYNLILAPTDRDPEWAFLGHLDTVPAFNMESLEPWTESDGDTIHGLGAADMKGGCAAMLEAYVAATAARGAPPAVALYLVVGEEEEGDGTEALLHEYGASWALVGEPTRLRPCLEHYGFVEIELTTTGTRRHASCAGWEHNAVRSMLKLLSALTEHFDNLRAEVVFNIRDMHSSEAGFAVPDLCSAWIDLHVPPRSPLGEITAEVEAVAAAAMEAWGAQVQTVARSTAGGDGVLDEPPPAPPAPPVHFHTLSSGYTLPESGPFVDALRGAYAEAIGTAWETTSFQSHSDANLLWAAGIRPVMLGPGSLARAHTQDEAAPFSEIEAAARLYLALMLAGV